VLFISHILKSLLEIVLKSVKCLHFKGVLKSYKLWCVQEVTFSVSFTVTS